MIRIVLVEPREAGNVGAAARVMKNFGVTDLRIVGRHPALHPLAGWWASGADDVVAQARFVPTLEEAIGDAHLAIATTSSRGRTIPADLTPAGVAELAATLTPAQTLALVFGREDHGLTREEVLLCGRTAIIPTNPEFPVMNLAQSVGVFCYELSTIAPAGEGRVRAPAALLERLHARAERLLTDIEFLHPTKNLRIYEDVRTMAGRADLDEREVAILLGIISQIEWTLGRRG
ncbi:MAG: trmJ [Acidobacteria bacterium]|nr:trmJ [Acidobacteriota bacterium]